MALWDNLLGKSVDVIPAAQLPPNTLAWPFPQVRFKHPASLFVDEDQAVVFISRGEVADVFYPGQFTLESATLPALTSLKAVAPSSSNFRAHLYFLSIGAWSNLPWSTHSIVVIREKGQAAIRARATGTFSFTITNPAAFLRHFSPRTESPEAIPLTPLHNLIATLFAELVRTGEVATEDFLGHPGRLGKLAGEQIARELKKIGVSLTGFTVTNINLPTEIVRPVKEPQPAEVAGYSHPIPEAAAPKLPPAERKPRSSTTTMAAAASAPELAYLPDDVAPPIGPTSKRIPLADFAPDGIFSARSTRVNGPRSERLELPDTTFGDDSLFPPGPASQRVSRVGISFPPQPPQAESANGPGSGDLGHDFHISLNGSLAGPYDTIALAAKVREGSLTRSTLVWRQGTEAWVPAESVPELAELFKVTPPPLPPPQGTADGQNI